MLLMMIMRLFVHMQKNAPVNVHDLVTFQYLHAIPSVNITP